MNEITINTPAKINFGLNIVSKRTDGYHNLETLFYPLNLFDDIHIKKDKYFSLHSSNARLNNDQNNTIIRAHKLISEYTGKEINASVTLQKRIPMGAGMGGGSSDGAAALLGLNKLFDLELSMEELYHLALIIGSDTPFFIDPIPKAASSRGEVFREIKFRINKPLLIINPGIHVSTSWAFSKITPKLPSFIPGSIDLFDYNNFCDLKGVITNDFESVVFREFPEIESIKNKMYELKAEFSLMTGSGSTIFGIFPNTLSARNASASFNDDYFKYIEIPKSF